MGTPHKSAVVVPLMTSSPVVQRQSERDFIPQTNSGSILRNISPIKNNCAQENSTSGPASSNGKKIMDSLVKIISKDELDTELPCLDKKLLLFPNRKLANALNSDEGELTVESTESTLIQDSKEELAKEFLSPDNGRKLVLDNVDVHQLTHEMTEQHQNPDAHFCSLMATENRVSGNHLPYDKPICSLMEMDNGKCCPNKWEHKQQHDNYVELVSRVITQELPCLHFLQEVVLSLIPHQYSAVMKQKTERVSCAHSNILK